MTNVISPLVQPRLSGPEGVSVFPYPHLLKIAGMKPWEITFLLDEAEQWVVFNRQTRKGCNILAGLTQINLFFEDSTRTRVSFEIAGKRAGADVSSMAVAQSSLKKGETLIDTALNLAAMRADIMVVRHQESGAVQMIADAVSAYTRCAVINAGDGRHEHPTQALLDALTIRRRKGSFEGLTVAICGDILHSRVARSNFQLLLALGARVRAVAPLTLMPVDIERLGVEPFTHMDDGLRNADVVMMLRLQQERMQGAYVPSRQEYFHFYGLTEARLKHAKPDVLVMHPGPMNRGVEIASSVADSTTVSAITEQVEMGVAVRMACLDVLTRQIRGIEGWA